MSLLLRHTFAVVACAMLAAGCTARPNIVEAAPGTAPPETTVELPVDPPPLEESVVTTEPLTSIEPVLEDSAAIDIASNFVDELRTASDTNDFSAAVQLWSGYPDREDARSGHLASLLAVHPWLLEGELSFETFDSWAFEPQWASKVVVISNVERTAVTTLLLDRLGVIQRIDAEVVDRPRPPTVGADTLVFDSIPTEGSAIAYLDGVLLDEPVVDHEALTTTFFLPPATGRTQILVTSFATPELPTARATIIDRS